MMDRRTSRRDAERRGSFGSRDALRFVVACVLAGLVVVAAAACGSSSSSSSSSPGSATTVSSPASSTSSSASSTDGANVALAKTQLATVTGHPSPFPVTRPLPKPLPAGTKFAYLESSDPIGALFAELLKPGVTAIGGTFIAIPAGNTATSAQAAADTAIADHAAVVLIPAFLPSEFGGKLATLKQQGAKIVGAGMVGWQKYGIDWCVGCETWTTQEGRILADWAIVQKAAATSASFYTVPEFGFTASMWDGFKSQMATLCPKCTARNVPIEVKAIGTTAPQTIVNDLQSHSDTNVAVTSTEDMYQGLPAAMSAAGVNNVLTVGQAPTPEILSNIKAGKLTAGLAVDLNTYTWTMVDAGARLVLGQEPQATEDGGPYQMLEPADITFDPTHGWPGYPDFAQRFAKLWHPSS
jgi:ribose transport system substrate-binding protein